MTKKQFSSMFPTEEAAISYFYQIRYNGILTCSYCGATNRVYRYRDRPKACHCKNCNKSFSPFKDTIFEKSTTPLLEWFDVIRMFLNARKGISSLELHRDLGVTGKATWRMLHQIRLAMEDKAFVKFSGEVEVDEMYVGGKPQRYPKSRSTGLYLPRPTIKRGRGTDHIAVLGLRERKSGRVYAQVMPLILSPKGGYKRLSGPQIKAVLDERCEPGTIFITDEFKGYGFLDKGVRVALWLLDDEEPPLPASIIPSAIKPEGLQMGTAIVRMEWRATGQYQKGAFMGRIIPCRESICNGILMSFVSVRILEESRPLRLLIYC